VSGRARIDARERHLRRHSFPFVVDRITIEFMTASYPAAKDHPSTPMGAIYAQSEPVSGSPF